MIVELTYPVGTVYHIKTDEERPFMLTPTFNAIRGEYSYRCKGYSHIQGTGLFELIPGCIIKVLDIKELTPLEGDYETS